MLRSIESNIRSFVSFKNTTERFVDVYWINFRGENVHYTNLGPGQSFMVNTFVTHPWNFFCRDTGERMSIDRKSIFYPESWFKYVNKAENGIVTVGRQLALITYPLKSLRNICLWRVLFLLNSNDAIKELVIPKTVKADLRYVCTLSTRNDE